MPLFSVFMKGRGTHFNFHLWLALQFVLIAFTFGIGVENQSVRCIAAEKRALLDFKKGLADYDNLLASWTSEDEECCKWKGVGCNHTTGHVLMLDLRPRFNYDDYDRSTSWMPLSGEIGSSLLELKQLNHLDLSFNGFQKIPEFMGSLTELTYLNLSSNSLTGFIPQQLGNLSRLLYLDLSNPYQMMSDNLEWVSRLSSLKLLKFGSTNFTKATNWLQVIRSHPTLSILHFEECDFPEVDPSSLSKTNSSNSLSVLHLTSFSLRPSAFPLLLSISSKLVELDFSYNDILSWIPDSFDNTPYLERINFWQNNLQGGIPKSLGNLCSLKELNLGNNKLSGALTVAVKHLSGCAKDSLEILTLGINRFNGSLPSFQPFSSLRELDVEYNRLSGHFQDNFGNFSKLKVLNFDGNRFTGPFPDLSRLSSLRKLSLRRNRLEGPLPVRIGNMSQLVLLDVSSNSLHGVISEAHLFNLTKLRLLFISFNALSFNLSSDWIPLFQLDYIDMSSCELGPKFPSWLRKQTNFSHLDISHSNISDTIPAWFWNLPSKLMFLNLSSNKFGGSVPNLPLKFDYNPSIYLSWNLFSGPIPTFLSNSTVLDLSNNMFSGALSFLCMKEESRLNYLDLSNNLFSGRIPDCWSKNWRLSVINLENNNLSGVIPTSLGSVEPLESLRLRNTSLYGEIPNSLQNCTELKLLDVGENKLTGGIPSWIGERLQSLIVLRLRSNEFHGDLPSTICQQQFLQVLDLSLNNISGTIPSCLNNLTAMAHLGSSDITIQYAFDQVDADYRGDSNSDIHISANFDDHLLVIWKGVEQEYGKTLGLLKVIDLSCNKLSGEIPKEIASLRGLISLNLSTNMLKGSITGVIGQLIALESLDLSANHLSGEIPQSLSRLSFLSVLDLSNNNLSGKIPSGTQLQSFNATSYSENPGLCGAPLRKCPGDETPNPPNTGSMESDEESFEPLWFFTGMTAGFLIGFWGIFGSLLVNRSWRHRYFHMVKKSADWIRLTVALNMAKLHRILRLRG
ncbi:hypothetical protein V6N13_140437 [Hibiscus sabdariffa]|uniref:Leucine-rich repeat-containing N-terminal plant-type domain-containing protein n=1 Tax=Hibiscus sabdariffa TaxID=183260 RepID=A0ABR2QAG0_9ROSI